MSERAIIYLDTNAWSDLSERKTAEAEEANARALDAHAKGRAIFPLSHSTISEFLKRDVNDDSREQAYLMDQLSDSVTLRNGQHIRDLEALGTYALIMDDEERPTGAEHMFTAAICHGGDVRIEFPDSWNASDADAFVDALLRRGLPGISYLQITERLDALLGMWAERDDIYARNMQLWQDDSRNWAADGTGKLRATRLRLEEYRFAVRRHFLARLARLLSDKDLERLTERVKRFVRGWRSNNAGRYRDYHAIRRTKL